METVSDGCPTGILIDIDLHSKVFENITKENEKVQASIRNKKEKIAADTKPSHPWTSNCFLDQTPPRPPPVLQPKFFTPKSNWKTPSPKSMKIISREASRIVDQLYSSPINCTEVMIYDEVFPVVKSLDDACLDEVNIKSKSLPTTEKTFTDKKIDQSKSELLFLTQCTISAVSSCTSKDFVTEEKPSTIVLKSDIKPAVDQDTVSENTIETATPENQESYIEFCESDKASLCAVNSSPVIPECSNESSDKLLAHEHKVTMHKKVAKSLGFQMSLEHSEKNKGKILQPNGPGQAKYEPRFSKTEKSCSSVEDRLKESKIRKNKILGKESMVEKSSIKNITTKCLVSEQKQDKENQNLEDSFSKNPRAFLQKPNVKRSQSLMYKRDPLCKTGPLLETPVVSSPIRRIRSFHSGSSRSAVHAERKFIPTTDSCSRVIKPKMTLNQVSKNGNALTTPLQFGKFKLTDSSAANSVRRKSLAFNPNYSLAASGTKVAAKNDRHSTIKKPEVTSSNRFGLVKKLNVPLSHQKLKNDSLPRKLFP